MIFIMPWLVPGIHALSRRRGVLEVLRAETRLVM
jgi:hypothetical protein